MTDVKINNFPVTAQNDSNAYNDYSQYHGTFGELRVQPLEITTPEQRDQIIELIEDSRNRDGRDQILAEVEIDGVPTLFLLWADEITDIKKYDVGDEVTINNFPGRIVAIDNEKNEDGGIRLPRFLRDLSNAALMAAGVVLIVIPDPATTAAGVALLGVGAAKTVGDVNGDIARSERDNYPSYLLRQIDEITHYTDSQTGHPQDSTTETGTTLPDPSQSPAYFGSSRSTSTGGVSTPSSSTTGGRQSASRDVADRLSDLDVITNDDD